MKPRISIPLATLFLIFIPMLILSIEMNAFWINSKYDFPFVTIPAVLIGDPLLLPPLNYCIYLALKQVVSFLRPYTVFLTVFYCFLISTVMNIYTHYLWSHDAFTSFMDPQYGVLSMAGWWHIGISIVQIAIIFIFAVIWILTVKRQNRDIFKAFERATYILIAFNIVNMSGILVDKDLYLLRRFTPDLALTNLINASVPLIVAVLLLFSMRKLHRLTQSGSKYKLRADRTD
jgi:hypothetical protein